jgi:hypothetical protein
MIDVRLNVAPGAARQRKSLAPAHLKGYPSPKLRFLAGQENRRFQWRLTCEACYAETKRPSQKKAAPLRWSFGFREGLPSLQPKNTGRANSTWRKMGSDSMFRARPCPSSKFGNRKSSLTPCFRCGTRTKSRLQLRVFCLPFGSAEGAIKQAKHSQYNDIPQPKFRGRVHGSCAF